MLRFISILVLISTMAWTAHGVEDEGPSLDRITERCAEYSVGHTAFVLQDVEARISSEEQILTIHPVMARCVRLSEDTFRWEVMDLGEQNRQTVEVDGRNLLVQVEGREVVALGPDNRSAVARLTPGDKNTAIDVRFTDLISQEVRQELTQKEAVQVPVDLAIRNLVGVYESNKQNSDFNYHYYNFSESLRIWIEIHRDDLRH